MTSIHVRLRIMFACLGVSFWRQTWKLKASESGIIDEKSKFTVTYSINSIKAFIRVLNHRSVDPVYSMMVFVLVSGGQTPESPMPAGH
jgi:hypothetical protein